MFYQSDVRELKRSLQQALCCVWKHVQVAAVAAATATTASDAKDVPDLEVEQTASGDQAEGEQKLSKNQLKKLAKGKVCGNNNIFDEDLPRANSFIAQLLPYSFTNLCVLLSFHVNPILSYPILSLLFNRPVNPKKKSRNGVMVLPRRRKKQLHHLLLPRRVVLRRLPVWVFPINNCSI